MLLSIAVSSILPRCSTSVSPKQSWEWTLSVRQSRVWVKQPFSYLLRYTSLILRPFLKGRIRSLCSSCVTLVSLLSRLLTNTSVSPSTFRTSKLPSFTEVSISRRTVTFSRTTGRSDETLFYHVNCFYLFSFSHMLISVYKRQSSHRRWNSWSHIGSCSRKNSQVGSCEALCDG